MKLEQQVVSLELAQKLKELGVKQESLFYWFHLYVTGCGEGDELNYGLPPEQKNITDVCSAFTVAELGDMLPKGVNSMKAYANARDGVVVADRTWWCWKYKDYREGIEHVHDKHEFYADTEADARAKMLVYLLENKLITI